VNTPRVAQSFLHPCHVCNGHLPWATQVGKLHHNHPDLVSDARLTRVEHAVHVLCAVVSAMGHPYGDLVMTDVCLLT
jgi:hypothetical protein